MTNQFCEEHGHPYILVGWDEIDEEQFHSLIEVHACPFCTYNQLTKLALAVEPVLTEYKQKTNTRTMDRVVGAMHTQLEEYRQKDRQWQKDTPSIEGISSLSPPTTCSSSITGIPPLMAPSSTSAKQPATKTGKATSS